MQAAWGSHWALALCAFLGVLSPHSSSLFRLAVPPPPPVFHHHQDVRYAAEAFNSLKAIGVDCSQLCDAPGMKDVVNHISQRFVEKGLAVSGGSISSQPGEFCCFSPTTAPPASCSHSALPTLVSVRKLRFAMLACWVSQACSPTRT